MLALRVMVAGIGTDVGKTVVSAVLTTALQGDYWKPIQCGSEELSDSNAMKQLLDPSKHCIHTSSYSLPMPCSPHQAARFANVRIDPCAIQPPVTDRPLIIEGVGGICVPLDEEVLTLDLFQGWNCIWVVVSKNYLGSINHTLLTIDVLKNRSIPLLGLVFNGEANKEAESVILKMTNLPMLGRMLLEREINFNTIQRYAEQWSPQMTRLIH